MAYVWATLTILVLLLSQALQIFSMPANWVAIALVAFWKWLYPASMDWNFIIVLGVMAALAEVLEFGLQAWGASRYGATRRGNFGGIVGAVVGAILGAPFLFGLGALPGAFGGAYLGCLLVEMPGRSRVEALRAAKGAFVGKALGFTAKTAVGAVIVVLSIPRIWP
jgi:uncharacterized protein YqgC (DUF456 family)